MTTQEIEASVLAFYEQKVRFADHDEPPPGRMKSLKKPVFFLLDVTLPQESHHEMVERLLAGRLVFNARLYGAWFRDWHKIVQEQVWIGRGRNCLGLQVSYPKVFTGSTESVDLAILEVQRDHSCRRRVEVVRSLFPPRHFGSSNQDLSVWRLPAKYRALESYFEHLERLIDTVQGRPIT